MGFVRPTYKHAMSLWLRIRHREKQPCVVPGVEEGLYFHVAVGMRSTCCFAVETFPQFLRNPYADEARLKIKEWFGIDTSLASVIPEIEKVTQQVADRVTLLLQHFRDAAGVEGLTGDSLRAACRAFDSVLAAMVEESFIKGT